MTKDESVGFAPNFPGSSQYNGEATPSRRAPIPGAAPGMKAGLLRYRRIKNLSRSGSRIFPM